MRPTVTSSVCGPAGPSCCQIPTPAATAATAVAHAAATQIHRMLRDVVGSSPAAGPGPVPRAARRVRAPHRGDQLRIHLENSSGHRVPADRVDRRGTFGRDRPVDEHHLDAVVDGLPPPRRGRLRHR
nr:hypothetical protein [Gordonia sp. NB41Y]